MDNANFEWLPGRLARIISGGTRNVIKLSRPWQKMLQVSPETCPFCTKPQKEIFRQDLPAGWKLIENLSTPHRHHRLIIPDKCWDIDILWKLGGFSRIKEAIEIFHLTTKGNTAEVSAFIHVGYSAGQNISHVHWHVKEDQSQKPLVPSQISPDLLISKSKQLDIFAMGARAGECLILEQWGKRSKFENIIEELACAIDLIVTLGNEKFRSAEGLAPDFMVAIRKSEDGYFRYADYCPVLNMWGAPEQIFAPLEGGSITLPWPHELTASYLRLRQK